MFISPEAELKNQLSPTDLLSIEHRVILQMLSVLERMADRFSSRGAIEAVSAQQALDFLRHFADDCHHGKEEGILFERMVAAGMPREQGPIGVMVSEHVHGRELIGRMGAAIEAAEGQPAQAAEAFRNAARSYASMLADHIAREDHILYPMANRLLGPEEQAALQKAFERFEHAREGGRTHSEYIHLADALAAQYGVEPNAKQINKAAGMCGCSHSH